MCIHVRTRKMQKCKYKTIKRQKKKNTSVGDETPNLYEQKLLNKNTFTYRGTFAIYTINSL